MDYLIRFVQIHETFRRPEIQALATLAEINIELLDYSEYVGLFVWKWLQWLSYPSCHLVLLITENYQIPDITPVTLLHRSTAR